IFFFQAEDGIRDFHVTGVQTCALPIYRAPALRALAARRVHRARPLGPALGRAGQGRTGPVAHRARPRPGAARSGLGPARSGAARSEERRVGKAGWGLWVEGAKEKLEAA